MADPRQSEVWHKKPEIADRTINERKFCKVCEYYYSEMFTCPICYGEQKATERIIKLLEEHLGYGDSEWDSNVTAIIALIKGENK